MIVAQKWSSYHLKTDIKNIPMNGITLLYNNYYALSDQKCILVIFFVHPLVNSFKIQLQCFYTYTVGRPSKWNFFRIFLYMRHIHKTSTNLEFHESRPSESVTARKNFIFLPLEGKYKNLNNSTNF